MRQASLLENSSWNTAAYIVYTILMVISAPVYLHFLGIKQYGIYVLLNSVIAPMGMFNMGMGQAAVKYIAECLALNKVEEAEGYLQSTFLSTAVIGVAGTVVVIAVARILTARVFAIGPADQQIATAGVPWVAATWLMTQLSLQFTAVPTALQKYNIVSMGSTVCNSAGLGLGLFVLWQGGNLLTMLQVRAAWALLTVLVWCWIAKAVFPSLGVRFRVTWSKLVTCFRFGIWQTVGAAGGMVAGNADKAILGMYISDAAVGFFAIPITIVQVAYALVFKAADVLLPAISKIDSEMGRDRALWSTLRVSWLLSLLTTAMMGCFVVLSRDILRLYVGAQTAGSCHQVLVITALAAIAGAGSVAITQYLLGIGDTRWTAVISIVTAVITLAGSVLLVPRFGLDGAAWSDLLAVVLSRPLMHYAIWLKDGQAVRLTSFVSHLYGPALLGIPVCLFLKGVRDAITWNAGFLGVTICGASCFLVIAGSIVALDRLLPDWRLRKNDLSLAFREIRNLQRRAYQAVAFSVSR